MVTILITVHLLIALSLVVLVLLQRSEGGALGMGGGGSAFKSRGVGTALTRLTAILAACFFASSIGLTLIANYESSENRSVFDNIPTEQGGKPQAPQAPQPSLGGAPAPGASTPAAPDVKTTPEAPKAEIKPSLPSAAPAPEVKTPTPSAPSAPSAPGAPPASSAPPAPQAN